MVYIVDGKAEVFADHLEGISSGARSNDDDEAIEAEIDECVEEFLGVSSDVILSIQSSDLSRYH